MKQFNFILVILLILSACDKINDYPDNLNSEQPEFLLDEFIDINNDNSDDFKIIYTDFRRFSGPSHAEFITGSILPLDDNKLLCQNQEDFLFLEFNDTIKKNDNTNLMWTDSVPTIISIIGRNGNWDENWKIFSSLSSPYYIGIKLSIIDTEKIGWLLLDINTNNGKITVLDSRLSSSSELIIE